MTSFMASVLQPTFQFPDVYADLLETLWTGDPEHVVTEVNQRTGSQIRALKGATSFKLDLSNDRVPVPGYRKLHLKTAAAEVAWFFQGTKDVSWLRKYAPIWDKFVEDDGVTIDAAYGYRWRHQFGRDQMKQALSALRVNPSDRRIYVSNWDPSYDGLGAFGQKNVPCPVGFTLSILNGALHSTLLIRSSDVFVGLPYDVAGHAILMDTVAASLPDVARLGTMTVTLAHPHLYEAHYDMTKELLQQEPVYDAPHLQNCSIDELLEDPDAFVQAYGDAMIGLPTPDFNPRPEVIQ